MDQKFLSIRDVCGVLGVSRTAAYGLVKGGILPAVRFPGSSLKVPAVALEEFVQEAEMRAMGTPVSSAA